MHHAPITRTIRFPQMQISKWEPPTQQRGIPGSAICLLLLILLAACAPVDQRRSAGTVLDDQTVETRVVDALFSLPEFDERDHIKVEVHSGTLLMAGETQSENNRQRASEIAGGVRGVERVVNELEVLPAASASDRLANSYLTSKVNSVLTTRNPIAGVDATRVKVISARGIVYLMGTMTRAEGEAVTEVVRHIGGVTRVVKVFDYTD